MFGQVGPQVLVLVGDPAGGLDDIPGERRGRSSPPARRVCDQKEHGMPALIELDTQVTFVTDPVTPCAGADFTVSWQEGNVGDEPSAGYQDIFDMNDQGTGDSQELPCDALQPGEAAMRTLTFNLPEGNYDMNVVIDTRGPFFLGNVIIESCD